MLEIHLDLDRISDIPSKDNVPIQQVKRFRIY